MNGGDATNDSKTTKSDPRSQNEPLLANGGQDVPTQQTMMKALEPYKELFGGSSANDLSPVLGNYITRTTKQRMATYSWKADPKASKRGTVVLVHGFAEHLGRYNHVANFFSKRGYDVCGIDHKSHGLSEGFKGSQGFIMSNDVMSANLKEYILDEVSPREGPQFIYSHSTGGMVTFLAFDEGLASTWKNFKGVVYSAPLIHQPGAIGKPLYMCPTCITGCTTCCLSCGTCLVIPGVKESQLSTYQPLLAATRADPYNFGGWVNLSIVRTLLTGTVEVSSKLDRPTYPFFILQSPNDTLVDPDYSKALYEKAPSKTKKLEMDAFTGWRHELHNHEDWKKPLTLAAEWFESLPK